MLSEGQNLQDSAIIVNYDLPWAIIRLIQRAGRVDRIGQKADEILCYSFLPADGVERIIRLRARVRQRLQENAEVVGSDESFFEDDRNDDVIRDLFTERAGILDGDADTEVDLGSFAYQIWKNAIDRDPTLQKTIPDLPDVVFSTRPHTPVGQPAGRGSRLCPHGRRQRRPGLARQDGPARDRVTVRDPQGRRVLAETPALPRHSNHHDLVRQGRRADRRGREGRRRPARPPLGRSLPHL